MLQTSTSLPRPARLLRAAPLQLLLLFAVGGLLACEGAATAHRQAGLPDPQPPAVSAGVPSPGPNEIEVRRLLHGEGLANAPEVRDTMIRYAEASQAGHLPPDSAAAGLLRWLQRWEAAHPREAQRARAVHRSRAGERD